MRRLRRIVFLSVLACGLALAGVIGPARAQSATEQLTHTPGPVSVTGVHIVAAKVRATPPVIPDKSYRMGRGPNVTNRVVLTFDDCPKTITGFRNTLRDAEAANVGLALFPTGDCIRSGKFDVAYARARGHHVFNHSVSHPDLRTLSYTSVRRQLRSPGVVTTYGRPPYGAVNSTVRSAYRAEGMRIWLWNVDTNDWRGRTRSQVVNHVVTNAKPGDSVLMHMQWNGFNSKAISQMKSGLNRRGIGVCRNYVGTVPAAPSGMWC